MGKKGGASSVPTDPRIGQAADQSMAIGKDEWDWFKNTYMPQQQQQQQTVQDTSNNILSQYMNSLIPSAQGTYGQVKDTADQTTKSALQQMQTTGDIGNQIYGTWSSDYAPLYGQIAQQAMEKGGQADQDYQAMMARGDVAQAFANAQGQNERYLAQYGQSPISGVGQALNRTSGLNQAAQEAAAQTAARQAAANLGWTYKQDAANIGQGLLSAGQNAYSGSQAAGATALNAQNTALNASGTVGSLYGQALSTSQAPINSQATIGTGVAQGAQAASGATNAGTSGLTQQQSSQAQAQAAANQGSGSMWGSLLGAAGTVAGAWLGGPAGAAVGAKLGSSIGGS